MNRVFHKTVFALALTSFGSAPCLHAQEPATAQQNTEKSDEPKKDEARNSFDEIRKTVQTAPLADAQAALEAARTASPNDVRLAGLRTMMMMRLLNEGQPDKAAAEAESIFQTHLERSSDSASLQVLAGTSTLVRSVMMRANKNEKFLEMVDTAIAKSSEVSANNTKKGFLLPASQLTSLKAQTLSSMTQVKEADALLTAQIESLKDALKQAETQEDATLAASNLIKSRISIAMQTSTGDLNALSRELDDLIAGAVQTNGSSIPLMHELIQARTSEISRIHRDEPELAEKLLQDTLALVNSSELKKELAISSAADRLRVYESRIAAARLLKEMIGKPAPAFDVEAWAHGSGLTAEQMKGKVILLDFWAVWCGPCIATFPHLNEWYDEFHGQGLEIIGVTRQYGYTWNEEAGRASKAKAGEEVTPESELAMLDQFMKHHELRHASIVTPKDSDMNKRYGVTGIPHAVLIDRKGNIRMIKIGSGPANATALHEMIKQLVAEQ